MKTPKAPQTKAALRAAQLPALLLLGSLCGTALAATGIPDPCPESPGHTVTELHDMLVRDSVIAPIADTETVDVDASDEETAVDAQETSTPLPAPEFTTRLPGISASDMPRYRRHMFRTDI